ncbi:MAG: hypothetical protein KC486_16475, partial [Myxococcales bacterium]|nr:hypothetical protein [Myxococcales bacterium]
MGLFDRLRPTIASAPLVRTLVNLFGHRRRRIWSEGDRSHVELRALSPEHFGRFSEAIEASIGAFEGVRWLRINGALGRLIVSFDPELCALETIVSALEVIERGLGIADAPFAEVIPDYPADVEPIARKTVDLAADGLGVLLGTGLKLAGYRPSRAGFDAAALLTVVDNTPRIREVLTDYLGYPATEIGLGVTNAFVQAVGAGPIGPLVDMLVQGIKLRAELARRRAWRAREPELCGSAGADGHWAPIRKRQRPTELPEGAVERYANEALFASLGGFVVGLADTHDLEAATAPLFGGLPKAALYGRTVFGAELMRTLASRDVVVLRTHALRLLDRMDAVVIHERVLIREGAALGRITLADDAPREASLAALHRLFDGERGDPRDVREDDEGWRLAPLEATLAALPEAGDAPLARAARDRDAPVLLLARDRALLALVELQPALRPGAEALLASARRAGLRLVLAADHPALERFAEERVPTATIVKAIRDVQCDGDGVVLIADGPPEALAAADV